MFYLYYLFLITVQMSNTYFLNLSLSMWKSLSNCHSCVQVAYSRVESLNARVESRVIGQVTSFAVCAMLISFPPGGINWPCSYYHWISMRRSKYYGECPLLASEQENNSIIGHNSNCFYTIMHGSRKCKLFKPMGRVKSDSMTVNKKISHKLFSI